MKRALLLFCFLSAMSLLVQAHPQPPITAYVQESKIVCIAKVTKAEKELVIFEVEEVIKGKPPITLKLIPVMSSFPLNSEWLLAATGANQNSVGWAVAGDYGWVNAPIQRVTGEIRLVGYNSAFYPKFLAHPSEGLSLEDLKKLAATPVEKH